MSDSALRPGSEEEWEALLRQLRLQSQAQPQPFFYARIQARLSAPPSAANPWRWLRRPAYAAVLSALMLATSGDGSMAATVPAATHGSHPAQQSPH